MTEQTDLRELRKKIERASQMVEALCKPRGSEGSREWAMSIPARPDYDSDLVIGDGLDAGRAALERLEELDSERAEWVEAWDMMRDTILDDYGPLEINEILTTIDYHDPRQATPAPAPQQGGTDD